MITSAFYLKKITKLIPCDPPVTPLFRLCLFKDLREYSVSELHSVDAEMTKLEVEEPHSDSTSTCSYHSKGGFGHSTRGVR